LCSRVQNEKHRKQDQEAQRTKRIENPDHSNNKRLDEVAGEHHVPPIESVKIDAGNGSNEYGGKENGRDSDSHLERVACKLEDIPYRCYVEDEVA